ncbi:MAG: hypothetical protein CVU39_22230 [Chloroflexi bacterium HGW-Chloroflexi-10]|nr:MAG: hypothetical protein CVU39_22230 [Chloroflexi bacterium HGW-Chloroflexi-10]
MSEEPVFEQNLRKIIKDGQPSGRLDPARKEAFYQALHTEWKAIYKPGQEFSPVALMLLTVLILAGFGLWFGDLLESSLASQLPVLLIPIGGINILLAPAVTILIILSRRKQNEKQMD